MHATEPLLRLLFDEMPLGVAVFDSSLKLREWNETWAGFVVRYTETPYEGVKAGATIRDVSPGTAATLEPIAQRVLLGETITLDSVPLKSRGTVSYWDLVFRPLIEDGEVTGVVDITTEVTGRVLAAKAARERQEEFAHMFDATSDGIIITDPETQLVVAANEACARMHGYRREEFVGLHPSQFIHPDSLHLFPKFMETVLAGEEFHTRALDLRKDGSALPVEVAGSGFEHKGRLHFFATLRDITPQVAHEEDLAMRAQLASLGEEVGRILTRGGAIHGMLQATCQAIVDKLDASFARIWTVSPGGGELNLQASAGLYTHLDGPHSVLPLSHFAAATRPGESNPFFTNEIASSELVWDKEWAAREGIVAFAGYPIQIEGELVGALAVFSRKAIPEDFRQALASYAGAIAVGIRREQAEEALREAQASLERRVTERTEEINGLLDVSRTILSTLDLDDLLNRVLGELQAIVPYTGCSILRLQDGMLTILASRTLTGPDVRRSAIGKSYPASVARQLWDRVRSGEHVIIPDVFADTEDAADYRRIIGDDLNTTFNLARSWIAIPLRHTGTTLGVLTMSRETAGPFTPHEADLATAFGNQVSVAIANADLFAQAQRRAREMEGLAKIASSLAFDQPTRATLDALAANVLETTTAVSCSVTLFGERGRFQIAGLANLPEGLAEGMDRAIRGGAPATNLEALKTGRRSILPGVRLAAMADPRYEPVHGLVRDAPWDSMVITPLHFHGRTLGTLDAYYPLGKEPAEEELTLLTAIADQAAVAVENARLFSESESRVSELEALYEADEQLHQSLRLDHVLQALVDVAVDVLKADKSAVVVLEQDTGRLIFRAARGFEGESYRMASAALAEAQVEHIRHHFLPMVIEDASHASHVVGGMAEAAGIKALVDVPITIGGEIFGMFNVSYDNPRTFSPADLRLYVALSQRASVAIENARLFERSQKAASLEERQRLARELHDSVSQALYGIALGAKTARTQLDRDPVKAAEPLDYILSLAEAGLAELRSLIFELRPESLQTEGLVAAFEKQFTALRARHGMEVVGDLAEPDVRIELKEALYRVGQEAMHNTVKHAHATRLTLTLATAPDGLVLEIRDNGKGFDPEGDFPGHLGLRSMSERAAAVGGTLTLESSPGTGTCVRLWVPGESSQARGVRAEG